MAVPTAATECRALFGDVLSRDAVAARLSYDDTPTRLAAILFTILLLGLALGAGVVLGAELVKRQDPIGFAVLAGWLGLMVLLARDLRRSADSVPDWRIAALVVAASLGLRAVSVELVEGVALIADPMNYANLAHAVMEGRGLVTDDWQYGNDLRAYFPPLYPLLLAGFWSLFGDSMLATAVMNTLTDALAAWCLADAGRRLGQHTAGRFTGLAYFAWPAFTMAAGMPQKESLTLLLAILLLRGIAIWLSCKGAWRWRDGLGLGLWYGLLALTQPSLVMAPAAIALVLAWQRGAAPVLRLALTALPAFVLVLMPWLVRNWLLFHALVPFTTASGMMVNAAVYHGPVPFPETLFDLPEHTRGNVMGGLAWRAILADPLTWLRHGVTNMAGHFAYEEAPLGAMRHFTPAIGAEGHARLAPLLQGAWFALLAATGAAGWRAVRRRRVDAVLLYALAVLLAIGAVNLWFEFGERHRLVLTPLFLLIAAGGWIARGDATAGPARALGAAKENFP